MKGNRMNNDEEKGKMFVGGLSWETSQENLRAYFSQFGEVIDSVVMKKTNSEQSRGFGFVKFSDPSVVSVVLRSGPHQLDGRTIDPKECNPRSMQGVTTRKKTGNYPKVFLGGLPSNVTQSDLEQFFSQYGEVVGVTIMFDQENKKSRGFGFVSFEDDMAVERCCREHFVNLHGKRVEIKRAETKIKNDKNSFFGPSNPMGFMNSGGIPGAGGSANSMAGYQWGGAPNTPYGYGAQPNTNYGGWGATNPQQASTWGGYGAQSQSQPPYGSYGSQSQPNNQASYGNGWNWGSTQNGPTQQPAPSDLFQRADSSASNQNAPKVDYNSYGSYPGYNANNVGYNENHGFGTSPPTSNVDNTWSNAEEAYVGGPVRGSSNSVNTYHPYRKP